jgi:hypothetical protein
MFASMLWMIACTLLAATYACEEGVRDRSLLLENPVGRVDQLILYDANTDQPMLTISDGILINTAVLNVSDFNMEATTTVNGTVGSIKFGYNGRVNYNIDKLPPYSFCRNTGTNFFPCAVLIAGQHNVTVTSYAGSNANGTIGSMKTISFRIVNNKPTQSPTKAPTNSPINKIPTKRPTKSPTLAPMTCRTPSVSETHAPTTDISPGVFNHQALFPLIQA